MKPPETSVQVFSWEFSEILKNNVFTEHLRRSTSGHFYSLNNLLFFAIQWTNRKQVFYICEHCFIMAFKRDEYHELCIWTTAEVVAHRCSVKKVLLEISKKFTEKQMCQSLFFNKVAGLGPATLFKKRPRHSCFPVNFCEVSKSTFSYRTPPVAVSETSRNKRPIEATVCIQYVLQNRCSSK